MILKIVNRIAFGLLAMIALQSVAAESDRKSCQKDVQKYCSTVTPGGGRIMACLRAHSDKLTKECLEFVENAALATKTFRRSCRKEIVLFCEKEEELHHKLTDCLEQHQKQLSEACQKALDNVLKQRAATPVKS